MLAGHRELLLGQLPVDRALRIEQAQVPARDLLRLVARDSLGAAVPARDASFGVEHEDRVVLEPVPEHPEALLALAQRLLLVPALGQVARDLREAAQRA